MTIKPYDSNRLVFTHPAAVIPDTVFISWQIGWWEETGSNIKYFCPTLLVGGHLLPVEL